jgi:hypothetical protein
MLPPSRKPLIDFALAEAGREQEKLLVSEHLRLLAAMKQHNQE